MTDKAKGQIQTAYWETERRAVVLLREDWTSRIQLPPLFIGPGHKVFENIEGAPLTEYGRMAHYYIRRDTVTFLLDPEDEPKRELFDQPVYVAGNFNGWEKAIGNHDWILSPEAIHGKTFLTLHIPRLRFRTYEEKKHKKISFKFVTQSGDWLPVSLSSPNLVYDTEGHGNYELRLKQTGKHLFYCYLSADHKHTGKEAVIWDDGRLNESHPLPATFKLLDAKTELRLGVFIESDETVFRIFSPRATRVDVRYYQGFDSPKESKRLKRIENSVWEARVPRDLDGYLYDYRVYGRNVDGTRHFDSSMPILDPYALASVSHRGPGVIRDLAALPWPREEERFQPPDWHDLVIMECHLADLVERSGYRDTDAPAPRYLDFVHYLRDEFCYLRTLGLNAIELQPMQQSDKREPAEYHWGYMTTNFFSPESSYAREPESGSQIEEFREVVKAAHDAGLAVIIDVVYNHVGEPAHLLFLDKYYYFELDQYHNLLNWSGCGNDFRASAPMAKRLIIDSLLHWVRLFDVDGFRFDLAELIGVQVLKDIEVALKAEKPSLILIAEPWSFRGHISDQLRETAYTSWNDGYRNFMRDYVRGNGNQDAIKYFLAGSPGSFASWPAQTVNYTESHDDRTWIDMITERPEHNGHDPLEVDCRRTHLMFATLMMSYGIPMLSQGQDFLRSKHGITNSYQMGDINALDYARLLYYTHTHGYVVGLIGFRQGPWGELLRLSAFPDDGFLQFFTADGYSSLLTLYNADKSKGSRQILFGLNPHHDTVRIEAEGIALSTFQQIADTERIAPEGLGSALIPITSNAVTLPPLSCGIWVRGESF